MNLRSKIGALVAVSALACAPSAVSAQNVLGRRPGSVLIFPVHRSGPGFFTVVCVTNTALAPVTPIALGGTTNVHFDYVNVTPNPSNPFLPYGCSMFDRIEMLTPADTLCVLTTCHNAYRPGGQEGYLVVSAEDPAMAPGFAWRHNFLIGSELVLNAAGIAYSTNAISVPAIAANPAIAPAPLRFDGIAYAQLPDLVYIDSFVALAGSSLSLINFSGGPFDQNTLLFSVWNDNERALSTTLTFSCWFDQPMSRISSLFTPAFLASTAHDPAELDINCDGLGDLETGWACIESIGVRVAGPPLFGPGTDETMQPSYQTPTTMQGDDGPVLGAITAGGASADAVSSITGGRLLWESEATQANGVFRQP